MKTLVIVDKKASVGGINVTNWHNFMCCYRCAHCIMHLVIVSFYMRVIYESNGTFIRL